VQKKTFGEVKTWAPCDRQLCRKYSYQKLLNFDNPSLSYDHNCRGPFLLGHSVDRVRYQPPRAEVGI